MAEQNAWLDRLERVTNYAELQSVFAEIAAEARGGAHGVALATAIDQAIVRIEAERTRDEHELEAFQEAYEAFREDQKGIVGWFKRHLPFTHTRRQELEHRDSISDQQAEILADNLIIARAQMIKEQILPGEQRRTGLDAGEWRGRLEGFHRNSSIQDFAADLRSLTDELMGAHQFVAQLSADIEAFAAAEFSTSEDRTRKNSDLNAARSDLSAVESGVKEKEEIRDAALGAMRRMVHDDLIQQDPSFDALRREASTWQSAKQAGRESENIADEFHKLLAETVKLVKRQTSLPKELDELERKIRQSQDERQIAERRQNDTAEKWRSLEDRYQVAARAVDDAKSGLAAATQLYEAYQDEHVVAEIDPDAVVSPVEMRYQEMQQALRNAEQELRTAAGPYDEAKRHADEAQRKIAEAERQCNVLLDEQRKLKDDQENLERQIAGQEDRLHPLWNRVRAALSKYESTTAGVSWRSSLPDHRRFVLPQFGATGRDVTGRHVRSWQSGDVTRDADAPAALDFADRLLHALREDGKNLHRNVNEAESAMTAAFTRHCYRLLDDSLAKQVSSLKA